MNCEVTVRRPNGTIETLIHPKITWMNDDLLLRVNEQMTLAGRGQVISYRNIQEEVSLEFQREQICCKISAADEMATESWSREFHRTDGATNPAKAAEAHKIAAENARKELAEFDAIHPEIIDAIHIKKAAALESFMATN